MTGDSPATQPNQRYVFIDALRGIAALWVLLHHLLFSGVMKSTLLHILPDSVILGADYGAYGVQIFFVLSGFVIAHSLRSDPLTRQSIVNFILRRQIRLDPPYWCAIVLTLLLQRIELLISSLRTAPMPRMADILPNFFYLQIILKTKHIVGVAWTLCIEIQFYFFFIALLCLASWLSRSFKRKSDWTTLLVFLTGVFSIFLARLSFEQAWFIYYWFYFVAGVLCYWAIYKRETRWFFAAFCFLYTVSLAVSVFDAFAARSAATPALIIGFATVLAIYLAGLKNRLTSWWNNAVLQYLGRISYSLYLVHLFVISLAQRIAYKITGSNGVMAVAWCLPLSSSASARPICFLWWLSVLRCAWRQKCAAQIALKAGNAPPSDSRI